MCYYESAMEELIKQKIREIPNWPKRGVNFKDITPLIEDKGAFNRVIEEMARPYLDQRIDKIVGIDARGFILASALAYKLNSGVAIVRKKGKLPWKTISKEYILEYGKNTIEIHKDSVLPGERVLIVDDLLATGGTMRAAIDLIEELGGKIVGVDFLIELSFLNGREKLKNYNIRSLVEYQA